MTALDAARQYLANGWQPVPVPYGSKAPRSPGWPDIRWRGAAELAPDFSGETNVGVLLGDASGGLADVDLDCPEALDLAPAFLPPTAAVFGRPGNPSSHWIYEAKGAKSKRYSAPEGAALVELRSTGEQTVFPPSVHPSGEPITWAKSEAPAIVEAQDLARSVAELAAACLVRRVWPAEGRRQDAALALSGCLLRGGWSLRRAEEFVGHVARAAGDEEAQKRIETVRYTAQRLECGQEATGRPRLADLIGDESAELVWRWLGLRASAPSGVSDSARATIVVEGGELPEIVDQAEDALIADTKDRIFQRGNLLVRPIRAPAATMREIYRKAPGVLNLSVVDLPFLVEKFTRVVRWVKRTQDGEKAIDCPARVARTYAARAGDWRVATLLGVIEAPTLRPDGSIFCTPGYDPQTCLWFDPGGCEFPPIPDDPTKEDALKALRTLKEPLKRFSWVEDCDQSAALAAILTSLVRHSLRTAPLTAFRAPKMGSGKSLLADVVAMIATGRVASVMSQGKDEDEDKKRLLAILVEGVSVACVDNIERPFGGAALCSVLTQESWRDRVLGKTGTATVPTTTTWLATGNNLCFTGDITTRVIPCDLDPQCERPEERHFEVNLHDWVPQNRAQLVVAALTILRAYRVAGRPDQHLSVFGRFEDWSDWVRSALVWCGEADPCAGRARIEDTDPVRNQLRSLLTAWSDTLGTNCKTTAEVIKHADPGGQGEGGPLWQALLDVAAKAGRPDGRRLGNYLAKHERRQEADLRFERVGDRQRMTLWRCAPMKSPGQPGSEPVSFVGSVSSSWPAEIDGRGPGTQFDTAKAQEQNGPAETDSRNSRNSLADGQTPTDPADAAARLAETFGGHVVEIPEGTPEVEL